MTAKKISTPLAGNHGEPDPSGADAYGADAIRRAVLETWNRTPARFREDANAEEALVLVGYADRVVVELAANASDAAIAAGVPGRLRLSVVDGELRAANTGAPLTADGLAALASLRASAKRDLAAGTGHFGVGFTAVLSVTDRPQIHSAAGAVEFSLGRTVAAVEDLNSSGLLDELSLRHHLPPVLRLPWNIPAQRVPDGFTTEIRLPLREDVDATIILAAAGDYLLLTLPGLDAIELPDRTISRQVDGPDLVTILDGDASTSWRLARRSGQLSEALSGQRPIEEQTRRDWWITWAAPLERALLGSGDGEVLYAPTPTDEALRLPARLIGTFPVDDTRRHLAVGPLADFMVGEAIAGYLDLLMSAEPAHRLALIPVGGFGLSRLDTELRTAILEKARGTKLLLTVLGDAVAGEEAVVLPSAPDELAEMVAQAIPNLLPAPASSADAQTLRSLGVRTVETSEMSSALAGLGRGARFWGRLYELIGYAGAEDLADLPVPLADGRTVLGGRGVLIPEASSGSSQDYADGIRELVRVLPALRLVDPDAVTSEASRQLLQRLGGTPADPSAILADSAFADQIRSLLMDLEHDEPPEYFEDFAGAVLGLVASGGRAPAGLLTDLILTSSEDEPWPAGRLLLPESEFAALIDPEADIPFVARDLVDRFGPQVLSEVGVLANFRLIHDDSPSGPDHDLPDEELWWDEVIGVTGTMARFSAIADLDLIDDRRWPQALASIARSREAIACLQSPPGEPISYTRWWLANFANLDGYPPKHWKLPTATDLGGLYDVMPTGVAAELAELVGVQAHLHQALAADPEAVFQRLIDPQRQLAPGLVPRTTAAVLAALDLQSTRSPGCVRTMSGEVVPADQALVLDEPWLAQVLSAAELVPGGADPQRTANVLDLDLASEALHSHELRPLAGAAVPSETVLALLIWRDLGGDPADTQWLHQVRTVSELVVEVEDLTHRVTWWITDQTCWVDGSVAGWARLLTHRLGDWSLRHLASALWNAAVGNGSVRNGTESSVAEFGLD